MADIKQHGFKLDLENPEENEINEFLKGKPTTYTVVEAMKVYIRIEKAKQAAIDNMLNGLQAGLFTPPAQQAAAVAPAAPQQPNNKDDIEDFEL